MKDYSPSMHRLVKMKKIILAFALISIAAAFPFDDHNERIVNYDMSYDANGGYSFSYETTNGVLRSETGHVVNNGLNGHELMVHGSVSYVDENGMPVVVEYTADENGYHTKTPIGLPTVGRAKNPPKVKNPPKPPHGGTKLPPAIVATLLGG